MEYQEIFDLVLDAILPTEEEAAHIQEVITEVTDILFQSKIPKNIQIRFIEPQGSTGLKQTYLKNDTDVDLFIGIDPDLIFNKEFPSKSKRTEFLHILFKDLTEKWLIPCFKQHDFENVSLSYAEHPYVSASYHGIELDVVICFDLPAEYIQAHGPITAVDRTPHHSRFIRDHLTEDQRHDVCLFKQFVKSQHSYGDKSAVGRGGFIGYAAEILICQYDSLLNLFDHFHELQTEIINPVWKLANYTPNDNEIRRIHEKFTNDFLIFLDPTDQNRNVGASISQRAFAWVNFQVKSFIENSALVYFEKHPIPLFDTLDLSLKERECYFFIEFHQIKEDHYTKFRDKCHSLLTKCIHDSLWEPTDEARFEKVTGEVLFNAEDGIYCLALYSSTPMISNYYRRKGPQIGEEPFYSKFLEKHTDAMEIEGFLWIDVPRRYQSYLEFLKEFFVQHEIENLELTTIGSALDDNISPIASQSMTNLFKHVMPFIDWNTSLYSVPIREENEAKKATLKRSRKKNKY